MKPCKFIEISDIHDGNNRTDPVYGLLSKQKYVFPYVEKSNIVFVNGDFFDRSLGFIEGSVKYIMSGIYQFLDACAANDVTVRIVQGTFTHDRTQLHIFETYQENRKFTNDFRVIRSVTLEYIEKYDMRVLYIPDDMPFPNSDAIMEVVHEQMKDLGWDYVDYAFVHGCFQHNLPTNATVPIVFDAKQFEFVKFHVFFGHIHTASTHKNVIGNGSFERLAHGEEEPKGYVFVENNGEKDTVTFIENKLATVFRTFDYSDDPEGIQVTDRFVRDVEALPDDRRVYVRIIHPRKDVRLALGKFSLSRFKHVSYSHKESPKEAGDDDDYVVPEDLPELQDLVPPTEDLLPDLILEQLGDNEICGLTKTRIKELLECA